MRSDPGYQVFKHSGNDRNKCRENKNQEQNKQTPIFLALYMISGIEKQRGKKQKTKKQYSTWSGISPFPIAPQVP